MGTVVHFFNIIITGFKSSVESMTVRAENSRTDVSIHLMRSYSLPIWDLRGFYLFIYLLCAIKLIICSFIIGLMLY